MERGAPGVDCPPRGEPGGGEPHRGAPGAGIPPRGAPGAGEPHQGAPGGGEPHRGEPGGGGPHRGERGGGEPHQSAPGAGGPHRGAPRAGGPERGAPGGGWPPRDEGADVWAAPGGAGCGFGHAAGRAEVATGWAGASWRWPGGRGRAGGRSRAGLIAYGNRNYRTQSRYPDGTMATPIHATTSTCPACHEPIVSEDLGDHLRGYHGWGEPLIAAAVAAGAAASLDVRALAARVRAQLTAALGAT